jgi:N-acetylmuramoyl-L-alanine amidase
MGFGKNRLSVGFGSLMLPSALACLLALVFMIIGFYSSYAGSNGGSPEKVFVYRSPGNQVKTVVIDPGHGGKDPGCHGAFAHEADICLAIALKLGALIEKHYSDVKVVYTRKTDVFVELHNRAKIANDNHADLFICIHVNAAGDSKAYGTETWVMGLHKTETNLAVAKRENSVIEYEDDYEKQYEGFDPNTPEGSILFSLYQSAYMSQSISFASKVQDEVTTHANRHDRGVRQAGFLVLVYTAMPAVLIETGFATNPTEEKFLASKEGEIKMSESIFQAFAKYKKEVEGDKYQGMDKTYVPNSGEELKDEQPQKQDQNQHTNNDSNTQMHQGEVNTNELVYKVQFLSSKSKLELGSSVFKSIPEVSFVYENGWYKYMSGNTNLFSSAKTIKSDLVSLGYKDAFIVSFKGDQKVGTH